MHAFISMCTVAAFLAAGAEAAKKKKLTFEEKITRCAEDSADDYPTESSLCMAFFSDYVAANKTTMFNKCEEDFCGCSGGAWDKKAETCDSTNSKCDDLTCGCWEKCYAPFLDCNYKAIWNVFKMNQDCIKSEVTECVEDHLDDARKECKRGVDEGRISWMDTPLPEDCDEDLICAAGGVLPSLAVVLAAAAAAMAH